MKTETSLMPPSTDISGIQFSTIKSIGVIDTEGPEKYNNTEMKLGRVFTAATQVDYQVHVFII